MITGLWKIKRNGQALPGLFMSKGDAWVSAHNLASDVANKLGCIIKEETESDSGYIAVVTNNEKREQIQIYEVEYINV